MKKFLAMLMSLVLMIGMLPVTALATEENVFSDSDDLAVFWYDYSDAYFYQVRSALNNELDAAGIEYTNYDSKGDQGLQNAQIDQAIDWGAKLLVVNIVEAYSNSAAQAIVAKAMKAEIPIIFFGREVHDDIINSYDKMACYVGVREAEAGGKQGKMAADYIIENYEEVDLNNDGVISYIMMKGQLGNREAEMRTRYAVEFCNNALIAANKPMLKYYDPNNTDCFQPSDWAKDKAFEQMTTALSTNPMDSDSPIELVFANNDDAALGCVAALNNAGWNKGTGNSIPVFGIDCIADAMVAMEEGKMTGSVIQSTEGMAETIKFLVNNVANGFGVFSYAHENFNVDDDGTFKIRVPYDMILEGEVYESDYDYDYDYGDDIYNDGWYDDGWYDDFEGESGVCGDNLTWVLDENYTLTISGEGAMWDYYYDYPTWYEYANMINDVVIEEGVTYIGSYVFYDHYSLRDISIPSTVIRISDVAFYNSNLYGGIWVDEANESFSNDEYGILFNKNKTELVCVHNGIMGTYTVPGSVIRVKNNAFSLCWDVEKVVFTGNAPSFEYDAFFGMSAVVFYPENNDTWNEVVLDSYGGNITWQPYEPENPDFNIRGKCGDNLTWRIDDNYNLIISGEGAMWDYYDEYPTWQDYYVDSVVIEEGVTYIGAYAFSGLYGLYDITIPSTVNSIGETPFYDSSVYGGVWVDEANKTFSSDENGILFNKNKTELIYVHNGTDNIYTVPASVTGIYDYAFASSWQVNKIVFEGNAPSFGDYAFSGFSGTIFYTENNATWTDEVMQDYGGYRVRWQSYDPDAPNFNIGGKCGDNLRWELDENYVLTISGKGAMWDCYDGYPAWIDYASMINYVVIEEGVTYIGSYVFHDHNYLFDIYIPSTVTDISEFAFNDGIINNGIWVDEDNKHFSSDENGVLFNKNKTELVYIHNGVIGTYTVPTGVAAIRNFAGGHRIEKLIFKGNAPEFEDNALLCMFATAFYPENNVTWTEEVMQSYSGRINWLSYNPTAPNFNIRGKCGDDLTWEIDESHCLYITGEGEMWNFNEERPSWDVYRDKIEYVEIGNGVTSIGDNAFEGMSLSYIYIPASVEKIDASAFIDCYIDGYFTVDEDNRYYCNDDYNALFDKSMEVLLRVPDRTTSYTVPEGVRVISPYAFEECYRLERITLPASLTEIGTNAFRNCFNLYYIHIPAGVAVIGDNAFYDCGLIQSFTVDEENEFYSSDEYGVLFNKDKTELVKAPGYLWETNYAIPTGVETIADYAFSLCYELEVVKIPNTVTSIGEYTFANCVSLTAIVIPESVREIGDYAFAGCESLNKITVEGNNTAISQYALERCWSLSKIVFDGDAPRISGSNFIWPEVIVYYPENNETWTDEIMTGYGDKATFEKYGPDAPIPIDIIAEGECGEKVTWELKENGVLTISGEGDMENYHYEIGGCNGDSCTGTGDLPPWDEYDDEIIYVVIEEGVTSIGDETFESCEAMISVTIPDSVTRIGESAFNGCSSLEKVEIPDSVVEIDDYAFAVCSAFVEIDIPDSVTYIGYHAFWNCPGLKEANVSEYVTYLGTGAFGNCINLERIIVAENNPNYCSDENGALFDKDMTIIYQIPGAYTGKYTIPESVKTIDEAAFYCCDELTEVVIPEGVTEIGGSAFYGCDSLTEINIPAGVRRVGYLALYCIGLTELRFNGIAPEFDEEIIFNDGLTIYYPENAPSWLAVIEMVNDDTLTWKPFNAGVRPKGDVDGDGEISNTDLIMVARYIVELYDENTVAEIETYGDMDGDEMITNADLIMMARIIVGLV